MIRHFNTAAERREAVRNGTALEPYHNAMPSPRKDDYTERGDLKPTKYHWRDSNCVKRNYSNWTWETRDRMVDGADFILLPVERQCASCLHDFENA